MVTSSALDSTSTVSAVPLATTRRRVSGRALFGLTKPRLATTSVLTTAVAYFAARPTDGPGAALLVLFGTALAAGGALSLNQWRERSLDAVMHRTRQRPLPAGEVGPRIALAWSVALSVGGVGLLWATVNAAAAGFAAATIAIYGLIYTPLKRHTRWATEIGSISGALPAILGNAAAGDVWAAPGLALTAILLFWQMPHFFAIGWRCRVDYRAAGFPLLPAIDPTGARTGGWSLAYALVLLGVSIVPCWLGVFGWIYSVTAVGGGVAFVWCAWRFAVDAAQRDRAATRLFVASIVYMPVVMTAIALDQLV